MATQIGRFEATALVGMNQQKIEPDSSGYRRLVLGGYNMANESGIFYKHTPAVEEIYSDNGPLGRRIKKGILRGEWGHPKIAGMAPDAALKRLHDIDVQNISHHIRRIDLVQGKDEHKRNVILAYGEVLPSGPMGCHLKASLENFHENTFFSIRSFVDAFRQGSLITRVVKDVVTYDAVPEGGIAVANKYTTACLEEYLSLMFTEDDLNKAIKRYTEYGLEEDAADLVRVKTNLGWVLTEVAKPSILSWK